MKRQSVLCGSVWLIGAAVAAKLLGAVFRLPLTAMLGGAGMGYFSCAYGLFLPVFALSVTGINTAVSVLTAQALAQNDPQTAGRLGRIALRMFGIGGAFCSVFFAVFSRFPALFERITVDIGEAAAEIEQTVPEILSNPQSVMLLCAIVAAVILWNILHSVFVRPFVLVGVLRNYLESGMNDIPAESSFAILDSKSERFKKLHAEGI